MNRTFTNKGDSLDHKWYVVDAAGIPVGRLAGQVAQLLRGKNKPTTEIAVTSSSLSTPNKPSLPETRRMS
jgi:ribosomal protein L13